MKQSTRRLKLLTETVNHFNSNNRSETPDMCLYQPADPTKSEGCAIGRKIKSKKLRIELDVMGSVSNDDVFDKLPKNLQDCGQEFLIELQSLHDRSCDWNEKGLTESGDNKVSYIKRRFNLV